MKTTDRPKLSPKSPRGDIVSMDSLRQRVPGRTVEDDIRGLRDGTLEPEDITAATGDPEYTLWALAEALF